MRFSALTVAEVREETADGVVVRFAEAIVFAAGQYLTVRRFVDGEEVRRCYSICSPVGGPLQIGVKRVPGGNVSTWATTELRPGDTVEVAGPEGNFGAGGHAHKRIVAFAAGSGITPVLSIVATALANGSEAVLVYANRRVTSAMFLDELDDLKSRYFAQLRIWPVFSRDHAELELLNGHIDAAALVGAAMVPTDADAYYVCGPEGLAESVGRDLRACGVAAGLIRTERFTPGRRVGARRPDALRSATPDPAAAVAQLGLYFQGRLTTIAMHEGETILAAGLRERPDLPWSCAAGVCATCRARLAEGTVEMAQCHGLEDEERQRGFVLTCQAVPTSTAVSVDYDA